MIKLLTCQTWVSEWDWFDYARHHREQVPHLLVDRSPCTDPFLDPYALCEHEVRRPIISGLCRGFKQSLQKDDIYIYITRVDEDVCHELDIPTVDGERYYFGIAALNIVKMHESHEEAAKTFTPRRYVVAPDRTPYPPNLAHDPQMPAAVCRKSCILSVKRDNHAVHYTSDDRHSTNALWKQQLQFYHDDRQKRRRLRAAECRVHQVEDGRDILQLNHEHAPVLTPADWGEDRGEKKMTRGVLKDLKKEWADHLYQKIANGR